MNIRKIIQEEIQNVLNEASVEDDARKYVKDMVKLHGPKMKPVMDAIKSNLVNSKYAKSVTDNYISTVWYVFHHEFFPS